MNKNTSMNQKKRYLTFSTATAMALSLILALAPNAYATDLKWYVGAKLPIMFIDDTESKTAGTADNVLSTRPDAPRSRIPYSTEAIVEYDAGFRLSGILGYQVTPNIRVEGELFYGKAKVDKLTYQGVTAGFFIQAPIDGNGSGSPTQLGAMANVWYDFNSASKWTPYAGLGLGFIRVDLANLKYDENAVAQTIVDFFARAQGRTLPPLDPGFIPGLSKDTDTAFAWQFGAGVGYELSDTLTLDLGYRYQNTDTLKFKGENATGTVVSEQKLKVHLLEVGIRYRF